MAIHQHVQCYRKPSAKTLCSKLKLASPRTFGSLRVSMMLFPPLVCSVVMPRGFQIVPSDGWAAGVFHLSIVDLLQTFQHRLFATNFASPSQSIYFNLFSDVFDSWQSQSTYVLIYMDAYRELLNIEDLFIFFIVAVVAQECHDTFPSRVLSTNAHLDMRTQINYRQTLSFFAGTSSLS